MNAAVAPENTSRIQKKQTVSLQADYAAFVNPNGFNELLSLNVLTFEHVLLLLTSNSSRKPERIFECDYVNGLVSPL